MAKVTILEDVNAVDLMDRLVDSLKGATPLKARILNLDAELTEIGSEIALKKGSRNNTEDQSRIQKIHDLTNEMGVKCPEAEGEKTTIKAGARFSKDDFAMVQKLHDHASNLGAECGPFLGGIAPGADQSLKVSARDDVNPKAGKKKYGDVAFADEKNKKYPIDSEDHIRAAWNYINKKKNADKYSSGDLETIKGKIIAAWKKEIDKDGPPSAEKKSVSLQDLVEDLRSAWYSWWSEPEEYQGLYPEEFNDLQSWDCPMIEDVLDDADQS